MGGGSQGSKAKPKKEPTDQELLPTVYKSAGIGDSSEPACFFVFNGANTRRTCARPPALWYSVASSKRPKSYF